MHAEALNIENLENRVARLENAPVNVNLQALSDKELDAHIKPLKFGTSACYAACVAKVLRHLNAFPVVKNDPSYKSFGGQGGRV